MDYKGASGNLLALTGNGEWHVGTKDHRMHSLVIISFSSSSSYRLHLFLWRGYPLLSLFSLDKIFIKVGGYCSISLISKLQIHSHLCAWQCLNQFPVSQQTTISFRVQYLSSLSVCTFFFSPIARPTLHSLAVFCSSLLVPLFFCASCPPTNPARVLRLPVPDWIARKYQSTSVPWLFHQ